MAIRAPEGANRVTVDVTVDVADAVASRPTLDQEVHDELKAVFQVPPKPSLGLLL